MYSARWAMAALPTTVMTSAVAPQKASVQMPIRDQAVSFFE
ncbi:hypothetical protein [Rhizobium leguminosarum]|nr:hypothetical protein [Rhizobium leguminosarum]